MTKSTGGETHPGTVDLDKYKAGKNAKADSLAMAEIRAFRERTGISLPNTVDLEEYQAGVDAEDDSFFVDELLAIRELSSRSVGNPE